jgi:23S rRNA (pseudouridine1915-N3)-methyltransferase
VKLSIVAIGRAGRGPEADLASDYALRAGRTGRGIGLGPCELIDVETKKPGPGPEGVALLAATTGARLIACDERGKTFSSRAFADLIRDIRDGGERHLAFVIGGADGLDEVVRDAASLTLAFGPQTWPHALARAMLAEQIYRATTLLAGTPYHRD